jgi:hypothetical protein
LILSPAIALANVLPETALVVHVRPPGSPTDCVIPGVDHCSDLTRSTTDAVGLPAGIYHSWVRVDAFVPDSPTRRCVYVTLQIPATSATDEPEEARMVMKSWSRIKADSR